MIRDDLIFIQIIFKNDRAHAVNAINHFSATYAERTDLEHIGFYVARTSFNPLERSAGRNPILIYDKTRYGLMTAKGT